MKQSFYEFHSYTISLSLLENGNHPYTSFIVIIHTQYICQNAQLNLSALARAKLLNLRVHIWSKIFPTQYTQDNLWVCGRAATQSTFFFSHLLFIEVTIATV